MKNSIAPIGSNFGNGNFKGRSQFASLNLPAHFAKPDAFGEGSIKNGETDLKLNLFSSNKYNGEVFAWGEDVNLASSVLSSYGLEDRYLQKHYRLLTEFGMALLLNTPAGNTFPNLYVVTGVPSKELKSRREQEIGDAFKGGHVVSIDDKTIMFNVTEVEVLPEPIGTIMSLYYDDNGGVADDFYEDSYIAVIDVGNGTTDGDGLKSLRRQKDDSFTIPKGTFNAYKEIADLINIEHPEANATPQKVEAQIKQGNYESYEISKRKVVDIEKTVRAVFISLAEEIISQINQVWTNRSKFDRILLTGGGAENKYIQEVLKNWEPDLIVVENAQEANAIGFYRHAIAQVNRMLDTNQEVAATSSEVNS